MKKLFTSLIMLMTLLTASWAQTLKVGGVSVNLAATSVQTITGSTIQGKVTYDPNTKTLYLENATINGEIYGNKFGTSASDRHFIHLSGSNVIKSSLHGMRFDNSYVVLYGSAGSRLNINTSDSNSDYACIDTETGHFEVWGIRLIMNGKSCGFYGNESSGTLLFVNSMVTINCEGGAIQYCKSVTFDDCKCVTTGATHKSSVGYVGSSGTLLKSLEIWPLLTVGNEPVRTAVDYEYGTLYSWKWTKSTKTLEITGDISTASYYGIRNDGIDGLTVKTDGAYKISSNWFGLHTVQNTTFSGSGSLTLEGQSSTTATTAGIYVEGNKTITVAMNTLLAQGGKYGIYNPQGTLTLNKLNNNSIYKFIGETANVYTRYLNMNDMDIWTAYSYYNTSDFKMHYKGEVANKENTATGSWFAGKNQITYYPIKVGGTQVNNRNNDNIYSPFITSGTVSYDASTKTLTLDNVTLTAPEGNNNSAIFVGGGAGDVTIKFTGTTTDANLTANGDAITLYSNTTFTGTGNRVYIKSIKGSGIVTEDGINVLVDFPGYFASQGAEYGFYGDYPDGDVLTLKKKSSDTYGYNFSGKKGSIYYLGKLVLDNMDFFHQDGTSFNTPGCYWDEADHQVEQNGGTLVTTPVSFKSIKETLPVYICGKQLNRVENGTDVIEVGSPYITAGGAKAVCYDPATKTLTLDNATIDYQGSESNGAIKVDENAAVTITVEGTNTCSGNTNLYSTVWCRAGSNVTINGTGTLKAGGYQYGVYTWNGATAIIKGNVTVESTTDIGSNTRESPGKLVIGENAVVKARRICNISSLTLNNGQAIVAPAGAQFKNNGVYVDSELAQNVVIMKTEKYPIFVCGNQVNSYNCNDILGDGKMKYDPSTKTLTLDNAAIDYQGTASNSAGIKVENAKVTIIVKGDNSITGNNNMFSALWLSGEDTDVTLAGNGKLSLSGSYSRCNAVYLSSATLRVGGNVTLEANGNERGIGYNASPRGTLIVGENAIVKASTISSLQTLTLNDNHEIVEPAGAEFKNNGVYVGNTLAQNVVIRKLEKYGVLVMGEEVTSDNCTDILGDGKVSFNPDTKTLTLNNAKMNVGKDDEFNCITNYKGLKGLIIDVNGTCELNSVSDWSSLNLRMDATITGSGTLKLTGSGGDLYADDGANIIINNVNIEAEGCLDGGNNASLAIYLTNGKKVSVKSGVIRWKAITFGEGIAVTQPAGTTISDGTIVTSTNSVASNVVIELVTTVKYALTIAGTQVTSDNASDILGDGVFSYDAAKNILTINGDYTGDKSAISSYVDDLTIEVAGDCTFTATSRETIIYAINGLTFTGGNLTLASEAPDKDAIGIYVEHGTLYFKDAYVDVTGDGFQYAITGEAEVALVIESSNITASAHGEGCFKDFASMTLSGCYIDSPRGTVFENEALRDAEGNVIGGSSETETVVIKSGADAIEGIEATAGQSDIYDVAGRKLGSMSRGINIVRSADGKTRKVLRK